MKDQIKFFNQTQPQTLWIAVLLSYFEAAFTLLGLLLLGIGSEPLILVGLSLLAAACGVGIANEKRLAYYGAVVISVLVLGMWALAVVLNPRALLSGLIPIMIAVAHFVLLIHPMSRDHVKIWFR